MNKAITQPQVTKQSDKLWRVHWNGGVYDMTKDKYGYRIQVDRPEAQYVRGSIQETVLDDLMRFLPTDEMKKARDYFTAEEAKSRTRERDEELFEELYNKAEELGVKPEVLAPKVRYQLRTRLEEYKEFDKFAKLRKEQQAEITWVGVQLTDDGEWDQSVEHAFVVDRVDRNMVDYIVVFSEEQRKKYNDLLKKWGAGSFRHGQLLSKGNRAEKGFETELRESVDVYFVKEVDGLKSNHHGPFTSKPTTVLRGWFFGNLDESQSKSKVAHAKAEISKGIEAYYKDAAGYMARLKSANR